jgi:hypothetical protein
MFKYLLHGNSIQKVPNLANLGSSEKLGSGGAHQHGVLVLVGLARLLSEESDLPEWKYLSAEM